MDASLVSHARSESAANPRYNEIALYELSLYAKYCASPTALRWEHVILDSEEVPLKAKSISCHRDFVKTWVYCNIADIIVIHSGFQKKTCGVAFNDAI